MSDVQNAYYDALCWALPAARSRCFERSRHGPRPLRSAEHIEGLLHSQLTEAEIKQLKVANVLVKRTYTAVAYQNKVKKPWCVENPKHAE